MIIAHIQQKTGREQTLKDHVASVACLAEKYAETLGLQSMTMLLGYLHDMGKATEEFQHYLKWCGFNSDKELPAGISHSPHAPVGAIFAYEQWFKTSDRNSLRRAAAQMVCLCVYGHHTGLIDCLGLDGESEFLQDMENTAYHELYCEAKEKYLAEIVSLERLEGLFERACEELKRFAENTKTGLPQAFNTGMLTKLLLSILVDADRWDSACFEYGTDPFEEGERETSWNALAQTLERYLQENFPVRTTLDKIRSNVSEECAGWADAEPGIYRLSVPTGGGKTLSSLRFALKHAELNGHKRIFYIIPFNTILDQNAKDIKEALDQYEGILEHHSNVVTEEMDETERYHYRTLTERWNSEIILTSMVQFLNAIYKRKNTNIRRMHRLTNAILIFDEIQSLPHQCKKLFERAIDFLTRYCECTVVLCTATQPTLELKTEPKEMISDVVGLHHALKRVRYLTDKEQRKWSIEESAAEIYGMLERNTSVLTIVNTKAAAWGVYEKTVNLFMEGGWCVVPHDCSLEEMKQRAECGSERDILCVHLSTQMCPAHRLKLLEAVRVWTKKKRPVCCVSTALIEAGINVSFPIVIRSLTRLPGIVQAAGRCNRNCEADVGTVYLWDMDSQAENLTRLPEIQIGKNITSSMLEEGAEGLDMPDRMSSYFKKEKAQLEKKIDPKYAYKETTLFDLLSLNAAARNKAEQKNRNACEELPKNFRQSFRTAGEAFEVIDEKTISLLVPYEKGSRLIERLNGEHSMQEELAILREAQQYSVSVYADMFRRLNELGAVAEIGNKGIKVLKAGFYREDRGVSEEEAWKEIEMF